MTWYKDDRAVWKSRLASVVCYNFVNGTTLLGQHYSAVDFKMDENEFRKFQVENLRNRLCWKLIATLQTHKNLLELQTATEHNKKKSMKSESSSSSFKEHVWKANKSISFHHVGTYGGIKGRATTSNIVRRIFRFFHSKNKKYSFNILAACSESYIVWRNAKDESNFIGIKFEIEIICLNSHTRRSRRSVSVIPTVCCCLGLFVFTLISTIGEYRKSQHDKLLRGSHSNHSYTEHEQINSIISCERTF